MASGAVEPKGEGEDEGSDGEGFPWGSEPPSDDEGEGCSAKPVVPAPVPPEPRQRKESTEKLTPVATSVAPPPFVRTGKETASSASTSPLADSSGKGVVPTVQPSRKPEETAPLVQVALASLSPAQRGEDRSPPKPIPMETPWVSSNEVSRRGSVVDPSPLSEREERRRRRGRPPDGSTAVKPGEASGEVPRPERQRRRSSQVSQSEKKTELSGRPVRDPSERIVV